MTEALIGASERLADGSVLSAILLGSVFGFVFGAMPGLGSIQALALILPFTFGWDPVTAMFLYAGIMGSTSEGGSITAILLNTPGTPINAATCFDGYPMAQRGEAGRALGLAAVSSSLGALFGIVVLLFLIPAVRPIVLAFGPPEFFWLVVLGLITIAFASRGNLFKGLAAGGVGVLLSLIGYNDVFGGVRWTGGSDYLWDGIELVTFFIGIFAIAEAVTYAAQGGVIASKSDRIVMSGLRSVLRGGLEVFHYPLTFVRSSIIGTIVGIIPGIGGSVANFISYTTAVHSSRKPELFGTGHPEGIVASEAANDSKDGGAILPTVAFGIPGSAEMAVLLGALILHGIQPGPLIIRDHLDVVMALVLGLVCSNLLAGFFILFSANWLTRLTVIPVYYIAPVVVVMAAIGAFALRGNLWDIGLAFVAGFVAIALKRCGFPIITLAIGFVLGSIAERSFHHSLMIAYGSYSVFFNRPISLILVALIAVFIATPFLRSHYRGKVEEPRVPERGSLTSAVVGFLLFACILVMLVASLGFRPEARIVPWVIGLPTLILLLLGFALDLFPQRLRFLRTAAYALWSGSGESEDDVSSAPRVPDLLRIMAWIAGFFLTLFFLGFALAIPLFLFLFLTVEGKARPLPALLLCGVVWIVFYGLFVEAFRFEVWPGVVPETIPGLIGGGITPPL